MLQQHADTTTMPLTTTTTTATTATATTTATMPLHHIEEDGHPCNRIISRPCSEKDPSSSSSSHMKHDSFIERNTFVSTTPAIHHHHHPHFANTAAAATGGARATTTEPKRKRLLESLRETCNAWQEFHLLLGEIVGQPVLIVRGSTALFYPLLYIFEMVLHLIQFIVCAGLLGRQLSSHPGTLVLMKGYSRVVPDSSGLSTSTLGGRGGGSDAVPLDRP
jgi:hypothetical protein